MDSLTKQFDTQVPRYTSYPPVPYWDGLCHTDYVDAIQTFSQKNAPLSIYIHIPFCVHRCLFCGCSVILNNKSDVVDRYLLTLKKEIDLFLSYFNTPPLVGELHLGGGTPTHLNERQLARLLQFLDKNFHFSGSHVRSIEVDSRTLEGKEAPMLSLLKDLGFNRLSLGIQDTNQKVQRTVKRFQDHSQTLKVYNGARELGFNSICAELIYGLPHQTEETFTETIDHIVSMRPDRLALYSYAKVPWLKPHQKVLPQEAFPDTSLKLRLYLIGKAKMTDAGYTTIGMDHFALPTDSLAQAKESGTLKRTFQGYVPTLSEHAVGFGVSSIGFLEQSYFQNEKDLKRYTYAIESGQFPIIKGKKLSGDDQRRYWVIQTLMCQFAIEKKAFEKLFGISFDDYFALELSRLPSIVVHTDTHLKVTDQGKLFIRNVASIFDPYYSEGKPSLFSRSI